MDGTAVRDKAVSVGEFREHAHITAAFELGSCAEEGKGNFVNETRKRPDYPLLSKSLCGARNNRNSR